MDKKSLRIKYRKSLSQMSDDGEKSVVATAATFIEKHHPKIIAIYIPQNYEIDLTPLMTKFPDLRFAVPKIQTPSSLRANVVSAAIHGKVDCFVGLSPSRNDGAECAKMQHDKMFFVNYYLGSPLERNKKFTKYYEPVSNNEVFPDMIFVPGLVFDIKGERLGMGRGHYDEYLACHVALKVGVCRATHLVERLPSERHDQRMDYVITEHMVLGFI